MLSDKSNAARSSDSSSRGTCSNRLVFTFRQFPVNPKSNYMPDNIQEQTRQVMDNIKSALEAAGSSLDKTIKTTVLLSDIGNFPKMNAVYATYFTNNQPSRTCYQDANLSENALIEIEAIAIL